MTDLAVIISCVFGLFVVIPALVYLCAKMITVGVLQGRRSFEHYEEQSKNGHQEL